MAPPSHLTTSPAGPALPRPPQLAALKAWRATQRHLAWCDDIAAGRAQAPAGGEEVQRRLVCACLQRRFAEAYLGQVLQPGEFPAGGVGGGRCGVHCGEGVHEAILRMLLADGADRKGCVCCTVHVCSQHVHHDALVWMTLSFIPYSISAIHP